MKRSRAVDAICCPYDEKPEGHSQGKDYKIGYGNRRVGIDGYDSVDDGKDWSKKQSRSSGLTDRKEL